MRRHSLALAGIVALGISSLTALPASASHAVTIAFPDGGTEFYSPFGGPAAISFAFDLADPPALFHVRLRPVGGTAILKKDYSINPTTQTSPVVKTLLWPALSTENTDRSYEVLVTLEGGGAGPWSAFFVLHPKLVRITEVKPDTFLPWIDDGFKDTTTVRFELAADAVAAEARVFRATASGRCCGASVLTDPLGPLPAGSDTWEWDGRDDLGGNRPKGDYFVRIWADDGAIASVVSTPVEVSIARTYRAKGTKSKPARRFHHLGPSTSTALGGGCLTYESIGNLIVLCQGGKMSVYWRWGLSPSERIVNQSFVLDSSSADCPRKIRSTSHTKHESAFTVNENLNNFRALCSLRTAKIVYSYLQAS
jgi:hypothetical protein